jgi:predicted nucleic acid-binding protein
MTAAVRLQVTVDSDDNIFLECADAARADYLVTGNVRHLPKFWKKTKVITPRELVGLITRISSCSFESRLLTCLCAAT